MQYSVLGPTGVKVSRICLGTATFGVAPSVQDADRIVGTALDLGINFVDTADVSPARWSGRRAAGWPRGCRTGVRVRRRAEGRTVRRERW